jgi:hypothetical protein
LLVKIRQENNDKAPSKAAEDDEDETDDEPED